MTKHTSEPARQEGRSCPGNKPSEGDSRQEAFLGVTRRRGPPAHVMIRFPKGPTLAKLMA